MNNIGTVDLFAFKLGYNEGTTPLYNGNISQTQWKTRNTDSSLKTYNYTYDALNRILTATDNTAKFNLTGLSYDKNGNIMGLIRQGQVVENPNLALNFGYGAMDNLVYAYDSGNKLLKVTDNANDTYGFKDGTNVGDDFTYDQNGNMKTDANKGITNIAYNHLNLPTNISMTPDPGYDFSGISYVYDATGAKLSKTVTTLTQVFGGTSGYRTTTQYTSSGFVYTIGENKDPWSGDFQISSDKLEFIPTAEGYVEPVSAGSTTFVYVYQYKDHLGNVRLSYADSNGDGVITATGTGAEIREENNFYPFGLQHKGYNNVVSSNANSVASKWKYQGQELDESLGYAMYEFELRHYDAAIGRFVTTDPYEQFDNPYLAMGNNPVVSFDPTGGYCYDSNGNQIACPTDAGDFYDDYVDSDENHITILDEAVVAEKSKETLAIEAYWKEINASAELLDKIATLETGRTSSGRADDARAEEELSKVILLNAEAPKPVLIGGGAMDLIGGKGGYKLLTRLLRIKSVSLPALKGLTIDMAHILNGHVKGGSRVSTMKTLFDSNLSPKQIENMIKAAYKNAKKLKTQGNRIKVVGQADNGTVIEMWVNKATKVIETAYPIN